MPRIKKKSGAIEHFSYDAAGMAAAEKAKAAGGQMMPKKKKKSRGK